ncbi:acetylglutamate kinase [Balneolales bacterium ANBcel1]|nr:acetylglutamate kinase [Balneolales bacterium ANBcel1]
MDQQKPIIVVKYGGNAMTEDSLRQQVVKNICLLQNYGFNVVIAHGGGPFIKEALLQANIESEFIDGHRVTTPEALEHVEKALKGQVNGALVRLVNKLGYKAVGLSGKDGKIATAVKRMHRKEVDGHVEEHDLGQVGDVVSMDTHLLHLLLDHEYIPVLACLAADVDSNEYNVNADMFAGHLAGALGAEKFIVLTDVDGLLRDINDPSSLVTELRASDIATLEEEGVIQGGMIPKTEACAIALKNGARSAVILNGTDPEQLLAVGRREPVGTTIL